MSDKYCNSWKSDKFKERLETNQRADAKKIRANTRSNTEKYNIANAILEKSITRKRHN